VHPRVLPRNETLNFRKRRDRGLSIPRSSLLAHFGPNFGFRTVRRKRPTAQNAQRPSRRAWALAGGSGVRPAHAAGVSGIKVCATAFHRRRRYRRTDSSGCGFDGYPSRLGRRAGALHDTAATRPGAVILPSPHRRSPRPSTDGARRSWPDNYFGRRSLRASDPRRNAPRRSA
jgi:hypothetical protein